MNSIKLCKIVLCQPQTPENIGAAARAMSVMGFNKLVIIDPKCDIFSQQAKNLASHAFHLVEEAECYFSLKDSIMADDFLFGFSARSRVIGPSMIALPELGEELDKIETPKNISLVFGSERTGLTNEELSFCHKHCFIPTFNEEYSSLNLAQAVQLAAYTLGMYINTNSIRLVGNHKKDFFVTESSDQSKQYFIKFLEQITLHDKMQSFCQRTTPERTLNKLKLIMNKVAENEDDLRFIHGFLKALIAKGV